TSRYGRGYSDRRFIDNNLINLQTEVRFPVYQRFGGVAFASAASLAPRISDLFTTEHKFAYGIGARYTVDRKQRTKLRLDVGFTSNEFNFYVTAKEAF
ncbi:MAG: hypothetical protein R3350_08855, partial [Saprospiraceae bacterium]|nr:hypothetical protein [Saprospiraceae bacterium]